MWKYIYVYICGTMAKGSNCYTFPIQLESFAMVPQIYFLQQISLGSTHIQMRFTQEKYTIHIEQEYINHHMIAPKCILTWTRNLQNNLPWKIAKGTN
jgi:hypothetical protein